MPDAGEYHAETVRVAVRDAVFVLDGSARLYHRNDAGLVRDLHTIGKREKRIAGHHPSTELEPETARLVDGLTQGVHTRGLARAARQKPAVLRKHDRIGTGVFHELVGEDKVLYLF